MHCKLANKYEVNTEPNALEKFDESAKHVDRRQSENIPGEVEDVENCNYSLGNRDFLKGC